MISSANLTFIALNLFELQIQRRNISVRQSNKSDIPDEKRVDLIIYKMI